MINEGIYQTSLVKTLINPITKCLAEFVHPELKRISVHLETRNSKEFADRFRIKKEVDVIAKDNDTKQKVAVYHTGKLPSSPKS